MNHFVRDPSDGMYFCKHCPFVAKKRPDMFRHVESRHLDLEYICGICDIVVKTQRSYRNHMKKNHPNIVVSLLKEKQAKE